MEVKIIYYLFIVNNYSLGDEEFKGRVIVDTLLEKNYWLFSRRTANIKNIKPEDEAIAYVAGKEGRYFYANIMITGSIEDATLKPTNETENTLLKMFPLGCTIKVLNVWTKQLYISDVKNSLDFITDKKNYGLFLRQATKVIGKKDYEYITNKAAEINNATEIESQNL